MPKQQSQEHRGEMSVREAGQRGGETRKQQLGHEGYSEIGHKGGIEAHKQHPDLAQRAGKKGGQKVRELINRAKEMDEE